VSVRPCLLLQRVKTVATRFVNCARAKSGRVLIAGDDALRWPRTRRETETAHGYIRGLKRCVWWIVVRLVLCLDNCMALDTDDDEGLSL
jgi:hypothetical protein